MKVCLITPPSPFLLDERVFPSLGILKIGSMLQCAGVEVDHLDLNGVSNYEDVVRDYIGLGCSTFGITATTPQLPSAMKICRILRMRGKVNIILGGPHATLVRAAARRGNTRAQQALNMLLQEFTSVVAGDGEKAVMLAVRAPYGMIDADNPKSPLWMSSEEYSAMPFPDRDLIDFESYHYEIDGKKASSMIAQLGCPFECSFCGGRYSPMLRRIRTRSAENIVQEMIHLHVAYGLEGLMMFDDELNVNKQIVELMRQIKATGIDWRLRGFVKAELFTEEQARAMYAAGFRWVLCGFESAHPRILRNINKKATLADNTDMLRTARKAGLKVKALMSIGHPGETKETILATRDWLIEQNPDDFDLTVITVYPGTPYYDNATEIRSGVFCYKTRDDVLYSRDVEFSEEAQYYKGIPGAYHSYVWTDSLSAHEIEFFRDEVEREVRTKLAIPYPTAAAAINYEHSMGMNLPGSILKQAVTQ